MTYKQLVSEWQLKKNIYMKMDKVERESEMGIALYNEILLLNDRMKEYDRSIVISHKPIGNYNR